MTEKVTKKEKKLYYQLHNKIFNKSETRKKYQREWIRAKRAKLKVSINK